MFVSGNRPHIPRGPRASQTYSFFKNQLLSSPLSNPTLSNQRSSLSLDWNKIIKKPREYHEPSQDFKFCPGSITVENSVQFPTGSTYVGQWNTLGMVNYGTYRFAHGCEYQGGFEDGRFHGHGTLTYPMGQQLKCEFYKGQLISYKFVNTDGVLGEEGVEYCQFPDRRFQVEYKKGLQPADKEILSNQQPTRPLPFDMCDMGDGYYSPESACIILSRDPALYKNLPVEEPKEEEKDSSAETFEDDEPLWVNYVIMASEEMKKWIMDHCRKGWDEPAGYRPDLYRQWLSGRKKELKGLKAKYEPPPPESPP